MVSILKEELAGFVDGLEVKWRGREGLRMMFIFLVE